MTQGKKRSANSAVTGSVSAVIGLQSPLLPGESAQEYEAARVATINELGAKTPLQVYLAEKILECLWWIRRYEAQKRELIVTEMAKSLKPSGYNESGHQQELVASLLRSGDLQSKQLRAILSQKGVGLETLMQSAYRTVSERLLRLDEGISIQLKLLSGFQSSFEHLVNRKLHIDRLQLQNDLLRRDLEAIDIKAIGHVANDDAQAS